MLFLLKEYVETQLLFYQKIYFSSYLFLIFCQIHPAKDLIFMKEIRQN